MQRLLPFLVIASIGGLHGHAALLVSADAGAFAVQGDSNDYGGVTIMSARVRALGDSYVGPGALGDFDLCANCPPGYGRSEANGAVGSLKAGGGVSTAGPGNGGGSATILDTITFLTSNPKITLKLHGEIRASDDPNAYAEMTFQIFIPASGEEGSVDQILFGIVAWEQDGDPRHTIYGPMAGVYAIENAAGIPNPFDFILDVPPYLLLLNDTLTVGFELAAGGGADNNEVLAEAIYDKSAYLGILGEYESANGYSYLGAPEDEGAPVPEPQTAALTLAGLGLALISRHARKGRA